MENILAIFVNLILAISASTIQLRLAKVVGGQDAEIGQFPWIISLRYTGGSHFCGGTIINPKWVLTAAHCVRSKLASSLSVVTGIVALDEDGDSYQVSQIVSHPNYTSTTTRNDIALLELVIVMEFNRNVQAVRLETNDIEEVDCVLIGWGRTTSSGTISERLQYVDTKTLRLVDCLNYWANNRIGDGHLCALTTRGEGACNGDSGGPLIFEGKQIGIVSWGSPCANGYPDVYTRVSSYTSWIGEYVNRR